MRGSVFSFVFAQSALPPQRLRDLVTQRFRASLHQTPGIGPGTVDSIRAELTCRARVHASLPHAAPHTTEPAP